MNPVDLADIVGSDQIRVGDGCRDFAVGGVVPASVVEPGTRDEAASLIIRARDEGWSVVPWGGGTQIDLGFPPRRLDLVVSTARLQQVVDYQPDDMTLTVEPGVSLARVERLLSERDQFLPLDPPLPARATVGGTVAAASSGPWRAGYGTPRDWVIGCRVIDAGGRIVRGGGQVVKNVAGYDLPKLYTGSFGTLGLLCEITFKVMPRPPARGYARVGIATPEAAEEILGAILDSDLQPAVVELGHQDVMDRPGPSQWFLFLQFLHVDEAVDWQLRETERLAGAAGCPVETLTPETGDTLLRRLRDRTALHPFAARIEATSSRAAEAAGEAAALCARRGLPAWVTAHAATGQVHVCAAGEADAAFCHELRVLAGVHGSCLFPRLPPALVGEIDPWGPAGPEVRIMSGIKAALDPSGTFSPGRFVGGL